MHDEPLEVLDARADALFEDHTNMMRNLVQIRHKHNLKQSVVAERMGVTQPSVSQFERYDANPTLDTVRRYAMAVGARVSTRVIDDLAGYLPNTGSANQVSITRTKTSRTIPWGSTPTRLTTAA